MAKLKISSPFPGDFYTRPRWSAAALEAAPVLTWPRYPAARSCCHLGGGLTGGFYR